MSYNYNTVLSCADSRILILYRFSKMSYGGILVIDKRISSHLVSKSRTSSLRRVIENNISRIKNCIMSTSDSKVVVDHVSDLSSTKKPVICLGSLFLQTDLFLEIGILDDLIQSRSNPRVQAFQNSGNPHHPLIAMI